MSGASPLLDFLPHWNAFLNAVNAGLLLAGRSAIRRGERVLHRRRMLRAVGVGALFVVSYVLTTLLRGHERFPGDDWVRTVFLTILGSHTTLAIVVAPLIAVTLAFALRRRFDVHRRMARWTFWVWLYVVTTGVVIYLFNHWVRPVAG